MSCRILDAQCLYDAFISGGEELIRNQDELNRISWYQPEYHKDQGHDQEHHGYHLDETAKDIGCHSIPVCLRAYLVTNCCGLPATR